LAKTTKVICPTCGKEFETTESRIKEGRGKYCSKECSSNNREKKKTIYCNCVVCGKEISYYASRKYNPKDLCCSHKCAGIKLSKIIKLNCLSCGKEMIATPSDIKFGKKKFCSKACHANSRKYTNAICVKCGKHFKAPPIRLMQGMGKYCSINCYMIDHANPHITNEDRERTRRIEGYNEWRISVFKRDNFTCQHCGSSIGGSLNAHHIIPYAKDKSLRLEISNGITLCKDCHMKEHARLRKVAKQQACLF